MHDFNNYNYTNYKCSPKLAQCQQSSTSSRHASECISMETHYNILICRFTIEIERIPLATGLANVVADVFTENSVWLQAGMGAVVKWCVGV